MRSVDLLIFILLPVLLNSQDQTRIVETDSSVTETFVCILKDNDRVYYTSKFIQEKFKNTDLVKTTNFHRDTITISSIYYQTKSGRRKGILRSYLGNGAPDLTINYDNSTWFPEDTAAYKNYFTLNSMKQKGDSVISLIYGKRFFTKHIKWNIHDSYYFFNDQSMDTFNEHWLSIDTTEKPVIQHVDPYFPVEWTNRKFRQGASEFYIAYDLLYEDKIYPKAITIIIDRNGKLMQKHGWNQHWTIYNTGLERIRDTTLNNFSLSTEEAFKMAYQCELKKQDSSMVVCTITWEPIKDSSEKIFNGNFRMVLSQPNPRHKKERKRNPSALDYTEWIFDPWTKELLEKRNVYKKESFDRIFGSNEKRKKRR